MTDIYLTYYKTEFVDGIAYYYLKAVFLPTTWQGSILLKLLRLLGQDLTGFFNLETAAPDMIAAGTEIYTIGGGAWSAPANLYKIFAFDSPMVIGGVVDASNLLASVPYVVYCAVSPADLPRPVVLPESFGDSFQAAKLAGSRFFFSDEVATQTVIVASRFNNFPFWTRVCPGFLGAYAGCVYDPNATPSFNLHCTLTFSAYSWGLDNTGDLLFLVHSGHAFKISSCSTSFSGFPLSLVQDGSFQTLSVEIPYTVVPVVVFVPDLMDFSIIPGLPPYPYFDVFPLPGIDDLAPFPRDLLSGIALFRGAGISCGWAVWQAFIVNGEPFEINGEVFEIRG